jgi:hypothetical protein
MGLTAWAQEEKAKREAWYENDRLKKRIAELEASRRDLIDELEEAECLGEVAKIARSYGYEG